MEVELAAAVAAARAAAAVGQRVREVLAQGAVRLKADLSPVTVADLGAQAVIVHLLRRGCPDIPVAAEEGAEPLERDRALREEVAAAVGAVLPELGEGEVVAAVARGDFPGGAEGRFWAVDPIDGTKGFLRGEQYAVAVALIAGGEVVLGVLACPNLPWGPRFGPGVGCLLGAVRGGGAWMEPLGGGPRWPLAVAPEGDPRAAVLCESVEAAHSSHARAAAVAARLGLAAPPLRMDSQCKYALLARGEASVYLRLPPRAEYREKIWDHAAGSLLVEEAGGRVSDLAGEPLRFGRGRTLADNRGVVATNGALHEAVLAAVHAVAGG